jgi:hypothetical protein
MFPDILSKKKKPKLSWKQRRQHRRQKDRAGAVSVGQKTGDVTVNEARNFTVTNRFGGIKYKNIHMAHPEATIAVTKPKIPIHHNYLTTTPRYVNSTDVAVNKARIKKTFKDFKKVTKKAGGAIKKVTGNIINPKKIKTSLKSSKSTKAPTNTQEQKPTVQTPKPPVAPTNVQTPPVVTPKPPVAPTNVQTPPIVTPKPPAPSAPPEDLRVPAYIRRNSQNLSPSVNATPPKPPVAPNTTTDNKPEDLTVPAYLRRGLKPKTP